MHGSAFGYARDHRSHHKYSDTEADPKNPSAGLLYAHIGWWFYRKTQSVKDGGNKLDLSDLKQDWVLQGQHRWYKALFALFGVLLPVVIPVYFWGEHPIVAFFVCVVFRITIVLHAIFTVNSLAHYFGARPFDFRMRPTENRLVVYLSLGEGKKSCFLFI